jgi:hypothetical protein
MVLFFHVATDLLAGVFGELFGKALKEATDDDLKAL